MANILVFIEHRNCVLNKTSLEAIAAAQGIAKDLGLKVAAVIPCDKDCGLAQEIAGYDLEKVIVAKNEKLGVYTPDAYADAWEQIIKTFNPTYIVMSHTYQVRDFAPKVAARLGRESSFASRAHPTMTPRNSTRSSPRTSARLMTCVR